jgi:hypothetical protein
MVKNKKNGGKSRKKGEIFVNKGTEMRQFKRRMTSSTNLLFTLSIKN